MDLERPRNQQIIHIKYNTEILVSSVFICRYSAFFEISYTDVAIGRPIGILKYRGVGIGIPTQHYLGVKCRWILIHNFNVQVFLKTSCN